MMMFFGFFWFVILIAIVIWAIYYVQSGQKGGDIFQNLGGQKEEPRDILKIRYAKGDINKEEYEKMLADLAT